MKYFQYLILLLVVASALNAEIYNVDKDTLLQENDTIKDRFFYGNFAKIIRFDPLVFENDTDLSSESKEHFDKIVKALQEQEKDQAEYLVTVIGHYEKTTDDIYEKRTASKSYGRAIYSLFEDEVSTEESNEYSKQYALAIKDKLLGHKIDEKLITVEFRSDKDSAYSTETSDGNALSKRVLVSMYVKPLELKDSDQDGVKDIADKCPGTPLNTKVDKDGCPFDSDKDGVVDYSDQCPNTLEGVSVDAKGCPLDDDLDGVANYKDKCPGTNVSFEVDINGCPLKATLGLHFETASSKILKDSHPKIVEFASFLKRNPLYQVKIIGHTDSRGVATMNMKLSKSRASSTKQALVEEGVESSRISIMGKGELEPIASNRTREGRQKNRRIEIELFEELEK